MLRTTLGFGLLILLGLAACYTYMGAPAGHAEAASVGAPTPTSQPVVSGVKTEQADFAAGCFWGSEATFRQVPGVVATEVGFEGGSTVNPTYRDVCTDKTGHAETVRVIYDPSKVNYQQLLDVFFEHHDPTTVDSQGPDFGKQYRSVIFYHSPEQQKLAQADKDARDKSGSYVGPIATAIQPAQVFYRAEDYHQAYFEKMGAHYTCHLGNGKKAAK